MVIAVAKEARFSLREIRQLRCGCIELEACGRLYRHARRS